MKLFLVCVALVSSLFQAALSSEIAQPQRESTDCQVCLYVMKFISAQTTQQELPLSAIRGKLNELFKILPSNLKNQEFLTNLGVFVNMIKEGNDPQRICKLLRKCATMKPEKQEITECQVCTAVVDLIKVEIEISNATIEVVIKAVEVLCAILGDVPVYEECKLILKDINQIIQWLEQKIDPKDICVRLGLCPKKTLVARSNHVKLATCHIVVHNIKIQIRKGWSEGKMKKKITVICRKLGLNILHCQRIQTSLKTILTMIKKGQDADEVCGNRIKVKHNGESTNYCDFCMMIMETVKTQLGDLDDGLEQIETKLNQLCSNLDDLSVECKHMVALVIGDIERNVKYAEDVVDPSEMCKALGLCQKPMKN